MPIHRWMKDPFLILHGIVIDTGHRSKNQGKTENIIRRGLAINLSRRDEKNYNKVNEK